MLLVKKQVNAIYMIAMAICCSIFLSSRTYYKWEIVNAILVEKQLKAII